MVEVWHEDFKHFDASVFEAAMRESVLHEPEAARGFFPSPGAVYKRAIERSCEDSEPGMPGHEAWIRALGSAKKFGNAGRRDAYQALKHHPPLTRTILAIGYDKLLRVVAEYNSHNQPMSSIDIEALRKEFLKIYALERTKRNEVLSEQVLSHHKIAIGEK